MKVNSSGFVYNICLIYKNILTYQDDLVEMDLITKAIQVERGGLEVDKNNAGKDH